MSPRDLFSWLRIAVYGSIILALASPADAKVVKVDCTKGQTINGALASTADDLVVEFSGVCEEDVLIARSKVTLRGTGGSPTIVGAPGVPPAERKSGIFMRGVSNIVLTGFTVDDSDSRGIEAWSTAALTVDDVVATDNRHGLILINQSSALVRNSSFDANAADGIGVWDNSSVVMEGTISANGNGRVGIIASGGSSLSLNIGGATITANNNLYGFALQLGAQALLLSAPPPVITLSGNSEAGISVISQSDFSAPVAVTGSAYGIGLEASASAGVSGSVSSCFIALYAAQDSLLSTNQMTITGNDFGLWLDGSYGEIRASSLQGSSGEDVHLEFGSRLNAFGGTTAGTVSCDGTVLTRGSVSCPASAQSSGVFRPRTDSSTRPAARPPREAFTIDG